MLFTLCAFKIKLILIYKWMTVCWLCGQLHFFLCSVSQDKARTPLFYRPTTVHRTNTKATEQRIDKVVIEGIIALDECLAMADSVKNWWSEHMVNIFLVYWLSPQSSISGRQWDKNCLEIVSHPVIGNTQVEFAYPVLRQSGFISYRDETERERGGTWDHGNSCHKIYHFQTSDDNSGLINIRIRQRGECITIFVSLACG